MTTAYTSLLGLALPVTGELSGTWGDTVNNSITSLLDTSVAGTTNVSTDTDVTLTTTTGAANTARQAILLFSGARTALRTVTAPAQSKIYTVINATTGGYSVKLVGAGPTTGLTIPNGASAVVVWNGSDFVEVGAGSIGNLVVNGTLTVTGATTLQSTLAVTGNITNTAGTANGVAYLNGSKVVTSGSALTFDGTTFTSVGQINLKNDLLLSDSTAVQGRAYGDASGVVWRAESGLAQRWHIGSSEQMRLTSTGLGIGTSSPTAKLHVSGDAIANTFKLIANTSVSGSDATIFRPADNTMAFSTNGTERARITSGGDLLVGRTSTLSTKFLVEGQAAIGSAGAGGNGIYLYINGALADNSYLSRGSAGSGTTTWYIGNQSITTSSDVRLKNNIKPSERNALQLLSQWEIVDHTWNDPSDQCENNRNSRGVWTGVVAQQVQSITPWLVNKPLEDMNEDGTINPWVMDFGYSVPLLVKAIQEQQAIIEQLKARLDAANL
jgi:hypothetical protein